MGGQMLNVRSVQKSFIRVQRYQTTILRSLSCVNFLHGNSQFIEVGEDPAWKNIDRIYRVSCRKDFCESAAGVAIHYCFHINASRSVYFAHVLDVAEEKGLLKQGMPANWSSSFLFITLRFTSCEPSNEISSWGILFCAEYCFIQRGFWFCEEHWNSP